VKQVLLLDWVSPLVLGIGPPPGGIPCHIGEHLALEELDRVCWHFHPRLEQVVTEARRKLGGDWLQLDGTTCKTPGNDFEKHLGEEGERCHRLAGISGLSIAEGFGIHRVRCDS